jgi:predicted acylesterase/phospholipase RssA
MASVVLTFIPCAFGNLTSVCSRIGGKVFIEQSMDGVLLSGGGTKGVAFAGALLELKNTKGIDWGQRCPPLKRAGGVSIGSFFALLIVLGYSVSEIVDMALRMNGYSMIQLDPSRIVLEKHVSLDSGQTMQDFLETIIRRKLADASEHMTLAELRTRTGMELVVFVTNLDKAELEIVSDTNPVLQALRASMALPPLLPPIVLMNEQPMYYADGGILCNYPIHFMPPTTIGLNLLQRKFTMASVLNSPNPFYSYMATTLETAISHNVRPLSEEEKARTISIECGGTCGAYELVLSDSSRLELLEDGKRSAKLAQIL